MNPGVRTTEGADYTADLLGKESVWWKKASLTQLPYRRLLDSLQMGFTLDVGCGLGRNLANLRGNAVGVDHNAWSVAEARRRGFRAFTPEDFASSEYAVPGRFDALLVSHVLEHMPFEQGLELVRSHLPYVKTGGKVVLQTPQEAGFKSDATHVEFIDAAALSRLVRTLGLKETSSFSHPFPRFVGRVFTHNAFVSVSTNGT